MTTNNAIKKIEKAGYKVEHVSGERQRLYRVNMGAKVLEFFGQGEDTANDIVHCIGIRRANDQSDPVSDYCAFTFYNNITQVLKYIS